MDEFDRRELRRMEAEVAKLRDGRWEERWRLEEKIREVGWRLDEHCRRSREKTTNIFFGVYYLALVGLVVFLVIRAAGS